MKMLNKISVSKNTLFNIVSRVSKKHLFIALIIGVSLLSSGVFILGSHLTKKGANEIAIAPTIKPALIPTPTITDTPTPIPTNIPTPIPTLTDAQYLSEVVTLHTCNGTTIQVTRSELPQYGHPYNYTPDPNFQNSSEYQEINTAISNSDSTDTTPQKPQMPQSYSCYTLGNTMHCSNGNTLTQNGNTTQIMGAQNGTCTTNGNYTTCSDGSHSYTNTIGNETQSMGSGGMQTCTHIGNETNCY